MDLNLENLVRGIGAFALGAKQREREERDRALAEQDQQMARAFQMRSMLEQQRAQQLKEAEAPFEDMMRIADPRDLPKLLDMRRQATGSVAPLEPAEDFLRRFPQFSKLLGPGVMRGQAPITPDSRPVPPGAQQAAAVAPTAPAGRPGMPDFSGIRLKGQSEDGMYDTELRLLLNGLNSETDPERRQEIMNEVRRLQEAQTSGVPFRQGLMREQYQDPRLAGPPVQVPGGANLVAQPSVPKASLTELRAFNSRLERALGKLGSDAVKVSEYAQSLGLPRIPNLNPTTAEQAQEARFWFSNVLPYAESLQQQTERRFEDANKAKMLGQAQRNFQSAFTALQSPRATATDIVAAARNAGKYARQLEELGAIAPDLPEDLNPYPQVVGTTETGEDVVETEEQVLTRLLIAAAKRKEDPKEKLKTLGEAQKRLWALISNRALPDGIRASLIQQANDLAEQSVAAGGGLPTLPANFKWGLTPSEQLAQTRWDKLGQLDADLRAQRLRILEKQGDQMDTRYNTWLAQQAQLTKQRGLAIEEAEAKKARGWLPAVQAKTGAETKRRNSDGERLRVLITRANQLRNHALVLQRSGNADPALVAKAIVDAETAQQELERFFNYLDAEPVEPASRPGVGDLRKYDEDALRKREAAPAPRGKVEPMGPPRTQAGRTFASAQEARAYYIARTAKELGADGKPLGVKAATARANAYQRLQPNIWGAFVKQGGQ